MTQPMNDDRPPVEHHHQMDLSPLLAQPLPIENPIERRAVALRYAVEAMKDFGVGLTSDVVSAETIKVAAMFDGFISGGDGDLGPEGLRARLDYLLRLHERSAVNPSEDCHLYTEIRDAIRPS